MQRSRSSCQQPPAGQCTQAETAVRQIALVTSHFTGVTTARGLAAAFGQLAQEVAASGSFQSGLVGPSTPPRLSDELRQVSADYEAFWAQTRNAKPRPLAVAAAAQKTMRDIRALRTTCPGR